MIVQDIDFEVEFSLFEECAARGAPRRVQAHPVATSVPGGDSLPLRGQGQASAPSLQLLSLRRASPLDMVDATLLENPMTNLATLVQMLRHALEFCIRILRILVPLLVAHSLLLQVRAGLVAVRGRGSRADPPGA
ncbi:unnamed protein product [Prorocentrum cordatum]|uniref:Autophagy-related protein 9 n=1 Tax=Prorocentrum cordatum TaxID=2364126 RepID=A0ABN9SE34_9DINO|nr:unnamed protein product [Polarella glacialis]